MTDFEKLGLFYLGRRYDLESATTLAEPVLYDSRDLVTHAVCVGMTGSGKTGLCIALIEEAAIDGVPVIAIDPKGDLGNLLLTFPRLAPDEFRPWIDEAEARRAGLEPDAYAAQQAEAWSRGVAAWGQDTGRVERLRKSAEFAIYTPGSRAGRPVSILSSFAPPPPAVREDAEALAERAANAATSVLTLAEADGSPRSREHTLVTALLTDAWRKGQDVDLHTLIQQVQIPPFPNLGVVPVDAFFPAAERFELAMRFNTLLASPSFEPWLEGDPLDPTTLLYTAEGRPRVSIFSIAHLGDAERMFFVSLLLSQVVSWMRGQTGTSSLRAILYMDEIAGYFPPVANPPSKGPLLTLLKQGRAFGIGVVLATQNPVDLDYKGLSNTGTWFVGRLQTERDKARLLDGLEGVAGGLDRATADRTLSALAKRVFLLHNVHDDRPTVFQTRWTMSYLRGPLSREQIRTLTPPSEARRSPAPAASPASPPPSSTARGAAPATVEDKRPVVPPGIREFFVPPAATRTAAGRIVYTPVALGAARIAFSDRKLGIDVTRDVVYAAPVTDAAVPVDWHAAVRLDIAAADVGSSPASDDAAFAALPPAAVRPRQHAAWEKAFARWLAQAERLALLRAPHLEVTSRPDESERDFRIRVQEAARAARDAAVDALRRKYAPKQAALAERLRRAESAIAREQEQASQQKIQTAVSMGATLLGALLGRRTVSSGTVGRATTTARGVGRSMKEAADVKRAAEGADAIRSRVRELEDEVAAETASIAAEFDAPPLVEPLTLAPRRGHVSVQFVGLGWLPR